MYCTVGPTLGKSWPSLVWVLWVFASLCACREDPALVVESAREALAAQDDEGFLELCTPNAAELLRQAELVQKRSGRLLRVLRDGRPTPMLLPKGEIGEVVESGHRAVVDVQQGERKTRVPLRLVHGQWKFDLLETEQLLDAIRPGAR